MVMPRSRSSSMLSRTWLVISRSVNAPVYWISRSARVDFPWSMWAMIAKLRIWSVGVLVILRAGAKVQGSDGDPPCMPQIDFVQRDVIRRIGGWPKSRPGRPLRNQVIAYGDGPRVAPGQAGRFATRVTPPDQIRPRSCRLWHLYGPAPPAMPLRSRSAARSRGPLDARHQMP